MHGRRKELRLSSLLSVAAELLVPHMERIQGNPELGDMQTEHARLKKLLQPGIISPGADYAVATTGRGMREIESHKSGLPLSRSSKKAEGGDSSPLKNSIVWARSTEDGDDRTLRRAVANVTALQQAISAKHDEANKARLTAIIGLSAALAAKWFAPNPPTEMREFKEKVFGAGSRKGHVAFVASRGDLCLLVKASRLDLCFELSKQFLESVKPALVRSQSVNGFKYLLGQDLSGFVDGTRNPTIEGVALETAPIPFDVDPINAGGSYLYAGLFVHNLDKLAGLTPSDRDRVIGREHATIHQQQRAHYLDIYNPRLPDVYAPAASPNPPPHTRAYHINRGYGVMLRQAWPYGTPDHCGLAFHAFSLSLAELDNALVRMAGEQDGVVDRLLDFTDNVASNYYYCPNTAQLAALALPHPSPAC